MFYYRIYGLNVQSSFQMDEAFSTPEQDQIDVVICEGELDEELLKETEEELQRGRGWFFYYNKEWAGVRHVHQGAFCMSNGNSLQYKLKPEHNRRFVSQVILSFCFSVILIQRGTIALHGSGIVLKDKAVILSGESGSGKSTLTMAVLNAGHQYLTDDIVAIEATAEMAIAHSGFPQRKLCQDTMEKFNLNLEEYDIIPDYEKEKYAIRELHNYHEDSMELGALIILLPTEDEEVELVSITGSEKLKYVIDNIFGKMCYRHYGFGEREFDQCVKIANNIDVYMLKRPKDKMTVKEQMRILEAIEWHQ